MSQPHFNLAQIDTMVRTIHSLKDEAEQISDNQHDVSASEIFITSRPPSNPKTDEGTPSADIINIIDRIKDLAADGEQADVSSSEHEHTSTISDLADLLVRIEALASAAHTSDIPPEEISTDIMSDEDKVLEAHKLDDSSIDSEDVDAAMQDIELAVRQSATANAQRSAQDALPEHLSETLSNFVREEVRSILKTELPETVRSLVRETLKSEGVSVPTRDKIRTRRFRKK